MTNVSLSGHHWNVSPRLEQFACQACEQLAPRSANELRVDFVIERQQQRDVTVKAHIHNQRGGVMTVHGHANNVYGAIRSAVHHAARLLVGRKPHHVSRRS